MGADLPATRAAHCIRNWCLGWACVNLDGTRQFNDDACMQGNEGRGHLCAASSRSGTWRANNTVARDGVHLKTHVPNARMQGSKVAVQFAATAAVATAPQLALGVGCMAFVVLMMMPDDKAVRPACVASSEPYASHMSDFALP